LGNEQFERAYADGGALSIQEGISLALQNAKLPADAVPARLRLAVEQPGQSDRLPV
jgi:hypothetical protein